MLLLIAFVNQIRQFTGPTGPTELFADPARQRKQKTQRKQKIQRKQKTQRKQNAQRSGPSKGKEDGHGKKLMKKCKVTAEMTDIFNIKQKRSS